MQRSTLFGAFLLLGVSVAAFDPLSYSNQQVLKDGVYTLHWKVEAGEVYVALDAQTTGWVGLGIAEQTSGSMPGADILTGFVTNGVAQIQDRYAMGKTFPLEDDCQNWELVAGEETNGRTIIEAKRKLVTGDSQDRDIPSGKVKVVWAYGASDVVSYHNTERLATAVLFYGSDATSIPNTPDIQTVEFLHDNYPIPTVKTTYYQQAYNLPVLATDAHIVALEQVIDSDTTQYVHHFLIKGCTADNGQGTCLQVWAWAPGIVPFVLPAEAGFKFGPSAGAYKSVTIEVHFDNPSNTAGLLDSSGLRLYYTTTLRQNDAGVLELGDSVVSQPSNIPAGSGTVAFEYNCPSECTSMLPGNVTLFADMLHMHKIGKQMWSTHWRNGEMIGEINRADFYAFDFQQNTPINVVLQPGDRINTHCVYQQANVNVPFGQASDAEMCIEYIAYWPKLPVDSSRCGYVFFEGEAVTACGNTPAGVTNPTVTDPVGGEFIAFGQPNDAAYECPVFETSSQPSSTLTQSQSSSTLTQSQSSSSAITSTDEVEDSIASSVLPLCLFSAIAIAFSMA